jgi:DNA-binding NtrC family response regulator
LHDALRQFAALDPGLRPRVIVTSSDELERAATSGEMLPELFALLRGSRVWLAPLRARRHEIEPLSRRFFELAKVRSAKAFPLSICPSAMARLCGYDWPGNVAELEKVIEDAVRSCTAPTLGVDDLCAVEPQLALAPSVPTILPPAGVDLRHAVEAFENSLILQALARTRWNKNQAAKLLGLNRTTLVEMLKRKGIHEA